MIKIHLAIKAKNYEIIILIRCYYEINCFLVIMTINL